MTFSVSADFDFLVQWNCNSTEQDKSDSLIAITLFCYGSKDG